MLKSKKHINSILIGCRRGDRDSQKKLYEKYFGFSFNICLRYAKNKKEASKILNDGWTKVFLEIKKQEGDFEEWLRSKIIQNIIQYYQPIFQEIEKYDLSRNEDVSFSEFSFSNLTYDKLLSVIQSLSPECRVVFCLSVIEKFSIPKISRELNIEERQVEFCLVKAKQNLMKKFNQD